MNIILEITPIISLLIALISVAFAWRSTKAANRSVSNARQSLDLTGLSKFIKEEYADRDFQSTNAPKIKNKIVSKLRAAKTHGWKQFSENPTLWNEESRVDKRNTWQNATAFEIGVALERLGAAAFSGLLPLQLLLALYGDSIVDDWLLCRSWIVSYRERESQIKNKQEISFYRRHAEWLALVAAVWLNNQWHYPNSTRLIKEYGGLDKTKSLISSLVMADNRLMPDETLYQLNTLLKIRAK
ncbi:MAG: hypothetical protein HY869_14060 [Chloroflexi bacterium]|nr:hypothetical protein [Chloroflexota bacterium]